MSVDLSQLDALASRLAVEAGGDALPAGVRVVKARLLVSLSAQGYTLVGVGLDRVGFRAPAGGVVKVAVCEAGRAQCAAEATLWSRVKETPAAKFFAPVEAASDWAVVMPEMEACGLDSDEECLPEVGVACLEMARELVSIGLSLPNDARFLFNWGFDGQSYRCFDYGK